MFSKRIIQIPINDSYLLYNTITKEIIQLNSDIVDDINQNKVLEIDNDLMIYLENNFYLQSDSDSDRRNYINLKNRIKYSKKLVSFVIHTNYSCNLVCDYCYQKGLDRNVVITTNIEREIIDFINNIIKEKNPQEVEITFIGGEPMLCIKSIKTILSNLVYNSKTKVIKTIVTNGTLLNDESVSFFIKEKFEHIQITIDGDKRAHDRFRTYADLTGSYDIIFNNLKKYSSKIKFALNINLNKDNYKAINHLLIDIKENNLNLSVAFSLVFDTKEKRFSHTINYKNTIWKDVHLQARKYGYMFNPFYRNTNFVCSLYKENEFIISPDGKLYKCICAVGENDFYVSKISEYGTLPYYSRLSQFIEKEPIRESCLDCPFVVHCGINCQYIHHKGDKKCYKEDIISNDIELIKAVFDESFV